MNQALRERFYSQGNKKHIDYIVSVSGMTGQEKWDEAHKHYVEKSAWIKTMLAM